MVELIVTDASRVDAAALEDYTLDAAWGRDENSFSLTCPRILPAGAYVYMDGSEVGGVVDAMRDQLSGAGSTLTYTGRTWHGVLAGRVIAPDAGKDHLTVSGDAATVVGALFARVGLSGAFMYDPDGGAPPSLAQYTFDRYVDLYTGLRGLLAHSGRKLALRYDPARRRVLATAPPIVHYGDTIDSDLLDFDANRIWLQVNHLIGLGKGEGADRAVSHWYADRSGNVSQKQTLTGVDEIVRTYDYSNADAAELADNTRKKLVELQSQGEVRVTVRDGAAIDFDVGDRCVARDNTTGVTVDTAITKKIVRVAQGAMSTEYEAT